MYGSVLGGAMNVPLRTSELAGSELRNPKQLTRGFWRNGVVADAWILSSLTLRRTDLISFLSVHSVLLIITRVTLLDVSFPVTKRARRPIFRCSLWRLMRSRSFAGKVSMSF